MDTAISVCLAGLRADPSGDIRLGGQKCDGALAAARPLFGVAAALGVFQALVLRWARPDVYQRVGRGAAHVEAVGYGGVLHIEASSTDRVR
jgi:hypothetical protein